MIPIDEQDNGGEHVKNKEPLSYPYFERAVPEPLINNASKDALYPTEWVGLRAAKSRAFTFVQMAYQIFDTVSIETLSMIRYRVFLKEDDCEGQIVSSSDLIKLQSGSGSGEELKQSLPDKELGRTWLTQVDADYSVLEYIHEESPSHSELKLHATICFLAQQVAEKAMTGGIIFFIGDQVDFGLFKDHTLKQRVEALRFAESKIDKFEQLEAEAKILEDHYLKTRYPNCWKAKGTIPADEYNEKSAAEAFKSAGRIRTIVKTSMDKYNLTALTYSYSVVYLRP